jgi:hypothetical protein
MLTHQAYPINYFIPSWNRLCGILNAFVKLCKFPAFLNDLNPIHGPMFICWARFSSRFPARLNWQRKRIHFLEHCVKFLGAFVKLRKRLLALLCLCFRLPVHSHETTLIPLDGFWLSFILICFNLSKKCKFHWNLTRITGTFTWRSFYIWDNISLNSS